MDKLIVNTTQTASDIAFQNSGENESPKDLLKNFASVCGSCSNIILYRCRHCRTWTCSNCDLFKHKFVPKGSCKLQNVREMIQDSDALRQHSHILFDAAKNQLKQSMNILNKMLQRDAQKIESLYEEISKLKQNLSKTNSNIYYGGRTLQDINEVFRQLEITSGNNNNNNNNNNDNNNSASKPSDDFIDRLPALQKRIEEFRRNSENCEFTAVQDVKGTKRYAKVEMKNNKMFVHALHKKPDVNLLHQVNYSDIQDLLGTKTECKTFFNLRWCGSEQGQVIMRMFPNYSRSANFSLVCSGEYGVSYRNTCFLWVGNKGRPGEFIEGGDYENNDGTGGASILPIPHSEDVIERKPKAGLVMCLGNYDNTGSQFHVNLRDGIGITNKGLGEVIEGLQLLREAANDLEQTVVQISDCGLVVDL